MSQKKLTMSRRSFFRKSTAATATAAGSLVTNDDYEAIAQNVNTNSQPSKLKITDLRVCKLATDWTRWCIKIYTNQGITGLGEIRDGSSPTYALMLKSRILGMNPCNVDKIFRKIKQFGHPARGAAGPVAIEEACWDIAGKAWGVPCWQMLGGKFRDKVLHYADTSWEKDPVAMGNKLKARMDDHGFKFLKMDIGIQICRGIEGCITQLPADTIDSRMTQHPFTGIRVTDKGLDVIAEFVATVRNIIGYEIPLASDHYGHMVVEDQIKLAQKLDQFNLAWYEDMVPWWWTEQLKRIKDSCNTPILTGEDIYLKEDFKKLFEAQAISICHPDIASSGGLLETKKIGDLAQEYGIAMAMHMAGSPITMMSTVHCAAATENFMVTENHSVDDEWYEDLVTGIQKPVNQDGYITVPDSPGLGIELNEDAVKSHLKDPKNEYFPPSDEWNDENRGVNDRLWSLNTGRLKHVHS
ncbi:mandelate racemase/muconate lactonizing enzyme family protein [Candidatus Latescibacterota bacterium]